MNADHTDYDPDNDPIFEKIVNESKPNYVDELNDVNFVVRDGSKTVVCRESYDSVSGRSRLVRSSFTDFSNFHSNFKVQTGVDKNGNPVLTPKGRAWLAHPLRRQYNDIVMDPSGKYSDSGDYNLWRGFGVPSVSGSWPLMQDHIFEIICDRDVNLYRYVMCWLARMIQHPETTGEVALVLQGGRGTGKGMLGNALVRILGRHSYHILHGQHLTGNFNAHLEDCIFLFADEAFWAGDKAAENVLKGLITEPTIAIERKGVDLKSVPNMLHVFMASNSDWVVPAGTDERRYCFLKVSECRAQDHVYFAALTREMDNGGLESMLYHLQHLDISSFNVRAVPTTKGLTEQKLQSLDTVMVWWFQKLESGELAPDCEWGYIQSSLLYDDYAASVRKIGGGIRCATETSFGRLIRKALPKAWPKVHRDVPAKAGYSSTKRVNHYEFPAVELCRKHFESFIGGAVEWQTLSDL